MLLIAAEVEIARLEVLRLQNALPTTRNPRLLARSLDSWTSILESRRTRLKIFQCRHRFPAAEGGVA